MTIDPLVVVAAFAAVGGLLTAMFRLFMTGAIHPRSTVPREDFDALLVINSSYAVREDARNESVKGMAESLKTMAATLERTSPLNGVKK